MRKGFEQTVHQRIKMANKHLKRCSALLIFRVMQIKTTMRYLHMPIRLAKIKNTNKT